MTSGDRHEAAAARRAPRWYAVLLLLAGATAWLYLSPRVVSSPAVWRGGTMGTTYTVKAAKPLSSHDATRVYEAVEAELHGVVARMSTYEPDSEVSRFARAPVGEPFVLSPSTVQVLEEALRVTAASGGAFDVTVRPLVEAWGFGADGRPERIPTTSQIEALRARVGVDKILVDPVERTVTKHSEGVSIDLSAIAKGFAVDRVASALEALGISDYLVEIGGETMARGVNERGAPWRIALQRPGGDAMPVHLDGHGVATSGNDKNFFERNGVRYGHTIDPREGAPVRHALAGASVIHASTATADAWATALMVLGPEAGPRLAEEMGLAAAFFVMDGGRVLTRTTPAFEAFRVRPTEAPR